MAADAERFRHKLPNLSDYLEITAPGRLRSGSHRLVGNPTQTHSASSTTYTAYVFRATGVITGLTEKGNTYKTVCSSLHAWFEAEKAKASYSNVGINLTEACIDA